MQIGAEHIALHRALFLPVFQPAQRLARQPFCAAHMNLVAFHGRPGKGTGQHLCAVRVRALLGVNSVSQGKRPIPRISPFCSTPSGSRRV